MFDGKEGNSSGILDAIGDRHIGHGLRRVTDESIDDKLPGAVRGILLVHLDEVFGSPNALL